MRANHARDFLACITHLSRAKVPPTSLRAVFLWCGLPLLGLVQRGERVGFDPLEIAGMRCSSKAAARMRRVTASLARNSAAEVPGQGQRLLRCAPKKSEVRHQRHPLSDLPRRKDDDQWPRTHLLTSLLPELVGLKARVWGRKMAPFKTMRDALKAGDERFQYLDAAQLVKHAFGLVTDAKRKAKSPILVYLFAEPNSLKGRRLEETEFTDHRAEITRFDKAVRGAAVSFYWSSYRDWLQTWPSAGPVAEHRARLKKRFEP